MLDWQHEQRLPRRVENWLSGAADRTLRGRNARPPARDIERHHFVTTTEIAERDAVGVLHSLGRTFHQPATQLFTSRSGRDQYAANPCNDNIPITHTNGAARPSDMAENRATLPSGDMEVVSSVAVRELGIPVSVALLVLSIEHSAQAGDVVHCKRGVCNDIDRNVGRGTVGRRPPQRHR